MISHYGLLRGESTRAIQLADMQMYDLENTEGPTSCDALLILLLNGKTNQEGRNEYMGAIRNRNWDICPLGALAMYFFYRYVLQILLQPYSPQADSIFLARPSSLEMVLLSFLRWIVQRIGFTFGCFLLHKTTQLL